MLQPYAALWSAFRGCLAHNANPINRLACFGYGFADEHVNAVIEAALTRTDFTLLIFAKELSDPAWTRWSMKPNTVVVTANRCSLKGMVGPGHSDLWRFERLCGEVLTDARFHQITDRTRSRRPGRPSHGDIGRGRPRARADGDHRG